MKIQHPAWILIATFLVACNSGVDDKASPRPIPSEMPADFLTQYHWSVGSLPPPYYYRYTITIGADAGGQIKFEAGYEPDESSTWIEEFSVTESELQQLYAGMYTAGIFDGEWAQLEDTPAGGSVDSMRVKAYGSEYRIPSYVEGDEKARSLRGIYNEIEGLVPPEIWKKLNTQHEKYVGEHEDEE